MHPITALMLTQAIEQDRRRDLERRRRAPKRTPNPSRRSPIEAMLRLPRFGRAASRP